MAVRTTVVVKVSQQLNYDTFNFKIFISLLNKKNKV